MIGLLVLGVYAILGGWLYRLEWHLYEGSALILLAVWAELWLVDVGWIQLYSTALTAYLVAMTYLYTSRAPDREAPLVVDIAAAVVGLSVPVALTIGEGGPARAMGNALWAIGLALAAVGGGVAGKVRAYFFGGVFALVFTALFRSLSYLTEFWPITLGFIGIMMLVIALTWERERALVKTTGRKVRETFFGWR